MYYRVLESLEKFLDEVEINNLNATENTTTFIYQTFALQVQNIDPSSFEEQTLNVDLGSVKEAMNITGDIDSSALITAMQFLDNATAAIHISEELFNYCTTGNGAQRLSYSVFLQDTLFRSNDPSVRIGSLIIAGRLKCNVSRMAPVGVNITLRSANDVIKKLYYIGIILLALSACLIIIIGECHSGSLCSMEPWS